MTRRLWLAVGVGLLLLAGSPRALAQNTPGGRRADANAQAGAPASDEKAARDAFERGRAFYDAGAFEQASTAFEEAYRLSGRDQLLYNLYLAHRDANQPAKAAEALRGYLAKVPNIENRAQLQARLAALDAGLAREREAEAQKQAAASAVVPTPAEVVAAPAPVVAVPAEPERPAHSKMFWAGVGVASAGGAMVIASIATGVLALHHSNKLKDDCHGGVCSSSLKDTANSGKTLAHTTDALLFGGLAVAAGGTALILFGDRERQSAPPVTAACTNHGCMASTTVRF